MGRTDWKGGFRLVLVSGCLGAEGLESLAQCGNALAQQQIGQCRFPGRLTRQRRGSRKNQRRLLEHELEDANGEGAAGKQTGKRKGETVAGMKRAVTDVATSRL